MKRESFLIEGSSVPIWSWSSKENVNKMKLIKEDN